MLIAVVDTPFLALNSKLVSVCNYGWTRMGSLWGIVSFLRLTTPILLLSTCRFTSRVDGFQTISTAMTSKSLPTAGLNGNPSPVIMHAEILDDFDVSSRLIIIGDVHGCLSELKLLLLQCSYQKEKDKIVLVGDLVNKGPYSAGVIKFVREIGASCVRGNHDDAALSKALQAKTFCKDLPSHYQYLKELNE